MELQSFDDLKAKYSGQAKSAQVNPLAKFVGRPGIPTKATSNTIDLAAVKYDTPVDAIYDRLSDGTYVKKFDNYLGAVGNEDRLGREQSGFEQAYNGIVKNTRKMGNYVLDATVGTVYGIGNAFARGSFEGFWNNDFSTTLDDWNKTLDNKLPNYYTDEQKSENFLKSALSVNFWANDVAGGVAFVGGALLPEIALAAVTGGASIGGSLAKLGFKSGAKTFLKSATKEVAEEVLDPTNFKSSAKNFFGINKTTGNTAKLFDKVKDLDNLENGIDLFKAAQKAKRFGTVGNTIDTGLFLARTSGFEAGMEARNNYKESIESFYEDFQKNNGRMPTFEESSKFIADATTGANTVFATNMAILSVSNAAMFGKAFNIKTPSLGKGLKNFGNKIIGLSTEAGEEVGKLSVKAATKSQRLAGNVYKILEKPATEGLFEEGLQGVIGGTMQNYLKAKYDPKTENSYSFLNSLGESFAKQYGTNEGWKEIFIGGIIGFAGGGISNKISGQGSFLSGLPGVGTNSRKAAQIALGEKVDAVNKGVDNLRKMTHASAVRNFRNMSETSEDSFSGIEERMMNAEFIKSQSSLKTPNQIREDFDDVIDNTDFDPIALSELEASGTSVDTYKQQLKEQFRQDMKNLKSAQRTVDVLGISNVKLPNLTIGNQIELEDALTMTLYTGQGALQSARSAAVQLEELIGEAGMFDAMKFFNDLTQDKKNTLSELTQKKEELTTLQEEAIKLGKELVGVRPSTEDGVEINRKFSEKTEKLVLTQQRINDLNKRTTELEGTLTDEFKAISLDITGGISTDGQSIDINTALEQLKKLDVYRKALESNGKVRELESVDYLITQFKTYSDAHRGANDSVRRMMDANFFSSKEGKGLLSTILGANYELSPEMLKTLKDNEEILDRALRMTGQNFQNPVEYVQRVFEDNDQLSDREKYHLETIIRMQLGVENLKNIADRVANEVISANATEITPKSPLEGDTIILAEQEVLQEDDLNTVESIDKAINTILTQVEYLRGNVRGVNKLEKKEQELTKLLEKRATLIEAGIEEEQNPGDYAAVEALVTKLNGTTQQSGIESKSAEIAELKREKEEYFNNNADGLTDEQYKEVNDEYNAKIARLEEELVQIETAPDDSSQNTTPEEQVLQKQYPNLVESISSTGKNPIKEVDDTIEKAKSDIEIIRKGIKIIDSPEWVRLEELTSKSEAKETTAAEEKELAELKEDVDQWLLVTGTVANGIRLSDLLRQKVILEETEIIGWEQVQQPNPQDILGGVSLDDRQGGSDLTLTLGWDRVTAISEGGQIIVQGITVDAFFEELGVLYTVTGDRKGSFTIGEEEFEFMPDDKGNISFSNAAREAINANTAISILSTNQDLSTNYSVVTKYDENGNGQALSSDYNSQTTIPMDHVATYEQEKDDVLSLEIDPQDDYNAQEILSELKGKSKEDFTQEQLDSFLERARKSMSIRVKDSKGRFLQVLKGKRQDKFRNKANETMDAIRNSIFTDVDFLFALANDSSPVLLSEIEGIKVEKVLLGMPNFNFVKNEDGTQAIEYKPVNEADSNKIVDIGFVENGNSQIRSKKKGVDFTFLKVPIEKAGKGRVPFVVVQIGNKRIAYPVRVNPREKESNQEFIDVYNSDASPINKVVALNKFLAGRGIDIKLPGNSFTVIGATNLNDEFFNEKLAQLGGIDYFYNLDEWLDPKIDQGEIVKQQVLLNINLQDPFHSPKLKLDVSSVNVKVDTTTPESATETNDDEEIEVSMDSLTVEQITQEAKEETETDCSTTPKKRTRKKSTPVAPKSPSNKKKK